MEIQDLLYLAFLTGGGEPEWLEAKGYPTHGYPTLPPYDELLATFLEVLQHVKSQKELEMVVDATVWVNLPWEIGKAAFEHLFELGQRDPKFLNAFGGFMGSQGGPDGDLIVEKACRQLVAEKRGELCEHLDRRKT